jgi:hypothetical protein
MSEPVPKPAKSETPSSNLSQVLSHGPAYRLAYGPLLGAMLMLVAINKTSRGTVGIAGAVIVTFAVAVKSWKGW